MDYHTEWLKLIAQRDDIYLKLFALVAVGYILYRQFSPFAPRCYPVALGGSLVTVGLGLILGVMEWG